MYKMTSLCYIENEKNEYLMLHRIKKENDINKDKYIGIGGKFEKDESPEDCVMREVYEETGLRLCDVSYRGIITFVSDICDTEYMHLFHSASYSGMLKECGEGVLEWIHKDVIKNHLPVWEGDKIFLDLLEKDVPFFSLKLIYSGDKLISAFLDGKEVQ